ncbi:MAG: hypothetical protein ACK45E_02825, partial [Ignavibacteria bacterium]
MNNSLRKLLACLFSLATLIAVYPSQSSAQMLVTVGGGPNVGITAYGQFIYPNPLMDYWWTIRSQYFLKASELTFHGVTPGQIVSLAFRIRNSGPWAGTRNVSIKIRQTTNPAITNPQTDAGMTTVYNNATYQMPVIANTPTWLTFPFAQPFMWDGVSNLHIEVCTYRTAYQYIFPEYEYVQPLPIYATQSFYYSDGQNFCLTQPFANGYSVRPTMQFGILSGIEQSFPDDVDPRRILRTGYVYDGVDPQFPKPSLSFRQTNGQNINITYRLVGPLPSENVIYQAVKAGNPVINHRAGNTSLYTYTFDEATGPAAGISGALNLTNIAGGSYRLEASYAITGYTQSY